MVPYSVGAVLLGTAALKLTRISDFPNRLGENWPMLGLAIVELAFASWALCGIRPMWFRRGAMVLFAVFSLVALAKGTRGDPDCGCFGPVPVSPWATLVFDIGVLAAITFCTSRDKAGSAARLPRWRKILSGVFAASIVVTVLSLHSFGTDRLPRAFQSFGDLVVLRPDEWVGKPLHLVAEGGESRVGDPLVIDPKTVNFGRVNDVDGPLELSFTIANQGDQPVEITGARSGCGCTVAQLVKSVVPPRGHLLVPVKVNILGRHGKFENRVLIDVSGRAEPVIVRFEGTIIQDLWHNGQAILMFRT